jgi:hypothetical protein
MIYEDLREPVGVRADFGGARVTPVAFRRKGRAHRVVEVAARWEDRRGGARVLFFSCLDEAGDLYQLRFDAGDVSWRLDAVQLAGEIPTGGRGRPSR